MWADEVTITVQAGNGGNGCMGFRREKYVPRGGPSGGDGGHGGDIVLEARTDVQTLVDFMFRPLFVARHGDHGRGKNQHGRDQEPILVGVPVGTLIYGESPDLLMDRKNRVLLADLKEPGMRFLAARGGRGGRGNASFATSTRQAPRVVEKGEPGEKRVLELELSLIADVGIVGLPNAGKSTLLSRVTQARPKIADYPFTTLQPQLGAVKLSDGRSFILADVPGLIEGASEGRGLGIQFLRHLERTRLLLHLVEVPEVRTLTELEKRVRTIRRELVKHHSKFVRIPQVLVLTKADAFPDRGRLRTWCAKLGKKWGKIKILSAVTGEGLDDLMETAWKVLQKARTATGVGEEVPGKPETLYRAPRRFEIRSLNGVYHVEGAEIRKWVSMTDFESRDGVERFHRILTRMGVIRELKKRGVHGGDVVFCEGAEMTYHEDPRRRT